MNKMCIILNQGRIWLRNCPYIGTIFRRSAEHRTSSRSGLTLVEVMLAMTILAIGTTGLVVSASRCLAVIRKARYYEETRYLYGRVDLEAPIWEDEIEEGSESGTFEGGPDEYKWSRSIAEENADDETGLYKITTKITRSDPDKPFSDQVVTYIYAPKEK